MDGTQPVDIHKALPLIAPQDRTFYLKPRNPMTQRLNDVYLKAAVLAGVLLSEAYIEGLDPEVARAAAQSIQAAPQGLAVEPAGSTR
jgi:hypothetical protein